jgi:hypothetical protein
MENTQSSAVLDGVVWVIGGTEVTSRKSLQGETYTPPKHLLISGHGRGGTTAVSKVISALGFTTDEPNDFMESRPLKIFNKKGDFDGLRNALMDWENRAERMFWKDPKIRSVHLESLLPTLPESIGFVFVFRDPLNIAIRNDDFSEMGVMAGLESAIKGYGRALSSIRALKDRKVVLVSYEKLLVVPDLVVEGIAKFLGIQDQDAIQRAAEVIEPNSAEYRRSVKQSTPTTDVRKRKLKSRNKARQRKVGEELL